VSGRKSKKKRKKKSSHEVYLDTEWRATTEYEVSSGSMSEGSEAGETHR
jgi:hypothetical protein